MATFDADEGVGYNEGNRRIVAEPFRKPVRRDRSILARAGAFPPITVKSEEANDELKRK